MGFDPETFGTGAGGGIIGSIVGAIAIAFGFKSRMDRQDKDIDELKNNVVYKNVFYQLEKRLERIETKIDSLKRLRKRTLIRQWSSFLNGKGS